MTILLGVVAVVMAAGGALTLYAGTDPRQLSFGFTLMTIGSVFMAGGLVTLALVSVIRRLDRLNETVAALPLAAAQASVPPPMPVEIAAAPVVPIQAPDQHPGPTTAAAPVLTPPVASAPAVAPETLAAGSTPVDATQAPAGGSWRARLGLGAAAAAGGAALAAATATARAGTDAASEVAGAATSAAGQGVEAVSVALDAAAQGVSQAGDVAAEAAGEASTTLADMAPAPVEALDVASSKVEDSIRSIEDELRALVEPLPPAEPATAPPVDGLPADFSLSLEEELERALGVGSDARGVAVEVTETVALVMPATDDVPASIAQSSAVDMDALAAELMDDPLPTAPGILPSAMPAPTEPPAELAAIASPPTAPLLREGVIAGIPFRLYGDGSIEADINGEVSRFASLKAFRTAVGG